MDFKENDVINVRVDCDILDVPEDAYQIDVADYVEHYTVDFFISKGESFVEATSEFDVEKGDLFTDSIQDIIEDAMPNLFEEISDYEIFDVNDKNTFESQTAKIRVKAVKEV